MTCFGSCHDVSGHGVWMRLDVNRQELNAALEREAIAGLRYVQH